MKGFRVFLLIYFCLTILDGYSTYNYDSILSFFVTTSLISTLFYLYFINRQLITNKRKDSLILLSIFLVWADDCLLIFSLQSKIIHYFSLPLSIFSLFIFYLILSVDSSVSKISNQKKLILMAFLIVILYFIEKYLFSNIPNNIFFPAVIINLLYLANIATALSRNTTRLSYWLVIFGLLLEVTSTALSVFLFFGYHDMMLASFSRLLHILGYPFFILGYLFVNEKLSL